MTRLVRTLANPSLFNSIAVCGWAVALIAAY